VSDSVTGLELDGLGHGGASVALFTDGTIASRQTPTLTVTASAVATNAVPSDPADQPSREPVPGDSSAAGCAP
jgi:hypothetical protein